MLSMAARVVRRKLGGSVLAWALASIRLTGRIRLEEPGLPVAKSVTAGDEPDIDIAHRIQQRQIGFAGHGKGMTDPSGSDRLRNGRSHGFCSGEHA